MARSVKLCGVYQILNLVNGHRYVGSSSDIKSRWAHHKWALKDKRHTSIYFQRAYDLYGKDAFQYSILESVERDNLTLREGYWIDKLKPEYCLNKFSDGIKYLSDETKERLRQANLGKKQSEETRRRKSEATKGKKKPEGFGEKVAANNRVRFISPETRKKIGDSGRGRIQTPETVAKGLETKRKNGTLRSKPGEEASCAKLTNAQALEIVALRRAGYRAKDLALKYGVTHGNISNICSGAVWSEITGIRYVPKFKRTSLTEELRSKVLEDLESGMLKYKVAEKYQMAIMTVRKISKERL